MDDLATIKNFTLWLQDVHLKVLSQANREAQAIAPPQWGITFAPLRLPLADDEDSAKGTLTRRRSRKGRWSARRRSRRRSSRGITDQADSGDQFPLGAYVLSIVGKSRTRKLHVVGGCYRIPGVRYREYTWSLEPIGPSSEEAGEAEHPAGVA